MTGREIIHAILQNTRSLDSKFAINIVYRDPCGCLERYQSVEYSVDDAAILIEETALIEETVLKEQRNSLKRR